MDSRIFSRESIRQFVKEFKVLHAAKLNLIEMSDNRNSLSQVSLSPLLVQSLSKRMLIHEVKEQSSPSEKLTCKDNLNGKSFCPDKL